MPGMCTVPGNFADIVFCVVYGGNLFRCPFSSLQYVHVLLCRKHIPWFFMIFFLMLSNSNLLKNFYIY